MLSFLTRSSVQASSAVESGVSQASFRYHAEKHNLGMLFPVKSHSRVSIETLYFTRVRTFHRRDRSWIAGRVVCEAGSTKRLSVHRSICLDCPIIRQQHRPAACGGFADERRVDRSVLRM